MKYFFRSRGITVHRIQFLQGIILGRFEKLNVIIFLFWNVTRNWWRKLHYLILDLLKFWSQFSAPIYQLYIYQYLLIYSGSLNILATTLWNTDSPNNSTVVQQGRLHAPIKSSESHDFNSFCHEKWGNSTLLITQKTTHRLPKYVKTRMKDKFFGFAL